MRVKRFEFLLLLIAVPFGACALNKYADGAAIGSAIVCAALVLAWAYLTGQRMKGE